MLLSLCVNPNIPQSSGIYKKLVRAFDPSCGKNEKDRKAREKKRSALRQKLMHGEEIPDHGIYPGLDAKFDLPKEEQMAVPVPASYFERLGEKIVRGVTYIESGLFIDPQFSIKTHIVNEHGAVGFEEALHKFGQSLSCGPGIAVNRAMMEEDKIAGIYKITIWQEFILYLTVSPINIGA